MKQTYIIFLALVWLLMYYPLLLPGYGFSLDQAFSYYYEWPKFGANNYWIHILWSFTQSIGIPNMILEKFIYVLVLWSITYYGYKIFSRFWSWLATTFGLLFLHINPFYYGRFIEWQVNIYISYAFFIIFFYYLIEYFYHKNYKYWKHISLVSLFLCLTSIHNIFFISLPLIVGSIYLLVQKNNKLHALKKWLLVGMSVVLINLVWIIPTMMREDLWDQIQDFWENHRLAFQSPAWEHGNLYFDILALKWYWWEWEWRFAPSHLWNEYYPAVFILILFIICIWIYQTLKSKDSRKFTLSLILIWAISYILGIWISQENVFSSFNYILYDIIPYYSGMREPHKWVVFLVLIYAYFGVTWVSYIEKYLQSSEGKKVFLSSFMIFILALPLIYTPAVMIGFWKQLRVIEYPVWWEELKSYLDQETHQDCSAKKVDVSTRCYTSLVLPWHWYINIDWTRKPIVLGSIKKYFWKDTLFWDTLETRNIFTQSTRPESKIIEKYTPRLWSSSEKFSKEISESFLTDLKSLWIHRIILLKEADYTSYLLFLDWLENDWFIDTIFENDYWIIYQGK